MISGVETYIPQRPPFVFIDEVVSVNNERAVSAFTIREGCPLVANGHLSLAGLMENAAQTCAVRAGYCGGNKIGFIGAVKTMQASRLPKIGETLTTEVVLVQEVMNISLIECTTKVADEVIATTTLKLAIVD